MNKMMNGLKMEKGTDKIRFETEVKEMKEETIYKELRNEAKKTMTEEEYRMFDFILSRHEIISKYYDLMEKDDSSSFENENLNTLRDMYNKIYAELFNTEDLILFNKLRTAISKEHDIILCKKALYEEKADNGTATEEDYNEFVKDRENGMQLAINMLLEINDSFEEYAGNDIYLNLLIDARSILEQDNLELDNEDDRENYEKVWFMICNAYDEINFDIDEYQQKLRDIEYIAREKLAKYNLPTNAVGQYW